MTIEKAQSKQVHIGLGSNIEQPYKQIADAIQSLNALSDTEVICDSGYYKSRPMGPKDQPDFINAVVELQTRLQPYELLSCCQKIEEKQGRVKKRHWGERSIDLDILLFADVEMKTEDLEIPHPGIIQRDFVYLPLLKVCPEIEIPGIGPLKNIVLSKEKQSAVRNTDDRNISSEFDCQYVGKIE